MQLQALLPGILGRIDFLLLDWDMQDFGELYGPLSSLDTSEWSHLMSRVLRFHDAVYMNHRSTFWSFPPKEQPDGQQQQRRLSLTTFCPTWTTHQTTLLTNPRED